MTSTSLVAIPHLLYWQMTKKRQLVSLNFSLILLFLQNKWKSDTEKNQHLPFSNGCTLQEYDNSFNTLKDKFWYNDF